MLTWNDLPSSLPEFLVVFAVMVAGATVQGSVGFGLSLIAAPILLFIDARFVPGPLLGVSIVLTLLILRSEHRHLDFSGLGPALAGRVPGTLIGLWLLVSLPAHEMRLMFGALLLLAVAMSATRMRFEPKASALVGAGLLSGVMSMTTSAGGPPLALVYQSAAGATLRATLSGHFLIGAAISIAALMLGGRLGRAELLLTVMLLPGLATGFFLSTSLHDILDRGYTRVAVLLISGISGLTVIVAELAG